MRSPDIHLLNEAKSSANPFLLGSPPDGDIKPMETLRHLFPEIVGRSAVMMRVLETVAKVARCDSSVLILGESGTGKELVAAAIHRLSTRADRIYVPLNCSAIPENLLESDLFGHERGAFTGADRRRPGKFEYAEGGTIFLDEIGDMAPSLQAKLLRVLQDKKFAPLGGNELKEVNVRIVAATNKNLEQAVKKSEFRLDLYYRLNVLPIEIPPLRQRSDDIPDLIGYFASLTNRQQVYHDPCYLADDLINRLCQFRWPGNIRQLQNTIERLFVMKGGGIISLKDLPSDLALNLDGDISESSLQMTDSKMVATSLPIPHKSATPLRLPSAFGDLPPDGLNLTEFIENLENDLIKQALERTSHNRNQAAKLLGLNRTTLVERIKKRRLVDLNGPSKEL